MQDCLTLSKIFYLMTSADGNLNAKEEELGKKMIQIEKINQAKFSEDMITLSKFTHEDIINSLISELKKKDLKTQINALAWSGLIANSDGFMDKREWQIMYQMYHKELKIDLQEIILRQRDLANEIIALPKTVI